MQTAAFSRGVSAVPSRFEFGWLRGVSPVSKTLLAAIENVAQNRVPILIVGENGTGKSALAAEVHRLSGHGEENFREVNCAEPDSDPAWGQDGIGQGGTVFFRHIAEMSANQELRAFLLLFDGNRDGGVSSTARVIASSPHTFDHDVRSGRFREDLYYRIGSFCLCVPPLRQRKEDVPLLAKHFAMKYSAALGRPFEISHQVLQLFSGYSWPGNIPELEV
jgi:DNA-binding NtrC family response regulator